MEPTLEEVFPGPPKASKLTTVGLRRSARIAAKSHEAKSQLQQRILPSLLKHPSKNKQQDVTQPIKPKSRPMVPTDKVADDDPPESLQYEPMEAPVMAQFIHDMNGRSESASQGASFGQQHLFPKGQKIW